VPHPFTCPHCGQTVFNLIDASERWCETCYHYCDEVPEGQPLPRPVEHFVDVIARHQMDGVREWVQFTRIEDELASEIVAGATEAGRIMGATIHAGIAPDDYEAPVRRLPGHVVVRVADTPAPWDA
jgi:hypothetical protein